MKQDFALLCISYPLTDHTIRPNAETEIKRSLLLSRMVQSSIGWNDGSHTPLASVCWPPDDVSGGWRAMARFKCRMLC